MQLSTMLLIAVSILTVLSGILVLVGSNKKERSTAIWFLLMALGATAWALAVGSFLHLPAGEETVGVSAVSAIFVASLLTMIALVGNTSWRYRGGRFFTGTLVLVGAGLIGAVICAPDLVFEGVRLESAGNIVNFAMGPLTILYGTIIIVCAIAAIISLVYQIKHARRNSIRNGYLVYLIGIAISLVCSLICDLWLPMSGNCALLWLGPVSVGATMIAYYYAILRYRLLILSSKWMKVLSYVILMATGAVIYMVIFFLIFTTLFKGARPSSEVILLNFSMILIVLLLVPMMNEINAFIKSLISVQEVDIAYIIKKLNRLAPRNTDLDELADFLAEHLHLEYVGFVIDNKLYGSQRMNLTTEELKMLDGLGVAEDGVWQNLDAETRRMCDEKDFAAVAELKNAKGKAFGQMIVGKPINRIKVQRKNLIQVEMIINLVAAIIDSEKHLKG